MRPTLHQMEQKVQQRLQNNPALLQALYTWVTEAETCKQLHALECSCLDGTRNMAQAMMSEQLAAVAQDGPAAGTRHGKKKVSITTLFGTWEQELQEWLDAQDRRWDPCKALGLLGVAHFWSHGVQRAAVHFATHVSFAKAQDFMQEHHRVRIDEDTLRRCTYVWGQTPMEITQAPVAPSATPCVTEMDGSMVGRVRTKAHSLDARHTRSVFYQEVKVAVVDQGAYRQYDATLQNADVAGAMWHRLVSPCLRPETYVHGVGDGAPWIRSQFHGFLGRRGKYLLDFYHAGDYLQKVAEEHGSKPAWVARQKEHLLAGRTGHLFRNLRRSTHSHREQGAAQTALGYLQKCQKHLHYLATQARDLPIGSGLIESTHRSVIQSRMKQPGMWWGDLGVHCMLRLRLVHHNDRWETLCNLRLP